MSVSLVLHLFLALLGSILFLYMLTAEVTRQIFYRQMQGQATLT